MARDRSFDALIDKADIIKAQCRELRKLGTYIMNAIRVCHHHQMVKLPALNRNRPGPHTSQRLRIQLLRGLLTEQEFKRQIQQKDKSNSRKDDLTNVLMTYRDALTDIVWPFTERRSRSLDEWPELSKEITALEKYVNECFRKVSETYGSSVLYEIMTDRSFR